MSTIKDIRDPILSLNVEDALLPGVQVEVDPDVAENMGAFEELALSDEDAWEANAGLPVPGTAASPAVSLVRERPARAFGETPGAGEADDGE